MPGAECRQTWSTNAATAPRCCLRQTQNPNTNTHKVMIEPPSHQRHNERTGDLGCDSVCCDIVCSKRRWAEMGWCSRLVSIRLWVFVCLTQYTKRRTTRVLIVYWNYTRVNSKNKTHSGKQVCSARSAKIQNKLSTLWQRRLPLHTAQCGTEVTERTPGPPTLDMFAAIFE